MRSGGSSLGRIGGRRVALVAALVGALAALAACEDGAGASGAREVERSVMTLASPGLDRLVESEQFVRARVADGVRMETSFGGAHQLVQEVNAGIPVDLLIVADRSALGGLRTPARSTRPWVRDGLVVVTSVHGGAKDDELLRGQGTVAVAGEGTPTGEFTRLALRVAGVLDVAKDRLRQHVDLPGVIESVANRTCSVGVVYATDAARERERVRVIGKLALPDGVDLVYFLAPLSAEGERLAVWLQGEEVSAAARDLGYEVVGALADGAGEGGRGAAPQGTRRTN